jgi:hypothetical protein
LKVRLGDRYFGRPPRRPIPEPPTPMHVPAVLPLNILVRQKATVFIQTDCLCQTPLSIPSIRVQTNLTSHDRTPTMNIPKA